MSNAVIIKSQCEVLQNLHDKLLELFGETKRSVQFFRHNDDLSIIVIQIRKGHLVDVGSVMMALSFFIRGQYDVFHGISMREQFGMPRGGFGPKEKYEYAFKHVFLRFKFHPELQRQIFESKHLKEGTAYQNMKCLQPIIVEILEQLDDSQDGPLLQSSEDSSVRT